MAVVVVGAYTLDLYMFGERLPTAGETVNCYDFAEAHGGKGANQAVAAGRLGASSTLIAKIGEDSVGENAYRFFLHEGIDTSYIVKQPGDRTGVGFIIVDHYGIQLITTYAGASLQLNLEHVRKAEPALKAATVLLLQGEIKPEITLEAARLAGNKTIVVLDPSPVESFDQSRTFPSVDILTPNEQEAIVLTHKDSPSARDVAEITRVPVVMLTRGVRGVEIYTYGETIFVPSPQAKVVDTTGAGDAFNGALAAGLDRGMDLHPAVMNACHYASLTVGKRFCIPSYPRLGEFKWMDK